MNSLKVPEGGLLLSAPSGADSHLLPQAFVLNLDDDVVQQMIETTRRGEQLELQLGKTPVCLGYDNNLFFSPCSPSSLAFLKAWAPWPCASLQ